MIPASTVEARLDALPYDVVLFDLDGTLTDPQIGITASYRHALAAVGRGVGDEVDLAWVIGPPIRENLVLLGVTPAELPAAVAAYRTRHHDVGLYEATLVPGIAALLADLDRAGVQIALATAKPTSDGTRTLDHFGLSPHFRLIAGNDELGTRSKADVIAGALHTLGERAPERVAMVGDRRHDIEGAAAHGLVAIGVTWGFAADGELATAGARHLATSVEALGWLLGVPARESAGI